jgi:hypothetical protein
LRGANWRGPPCSARNVASIKGQELEKERKRKLLYAIDTTKLHAVLFMSIFFPASGLTSILRRPHALLGGGCCGDGFVLVAAVFDRGSDLSVRSSLHRPHHPRPSHHLHQHSPVEQQPPCLSVSWTRSCPASLSTKTSTPTSSSSSNQQRPSQRHQHPQQRKLTSRFQHPNQTQTSNKHSSSNLSSSQPQHATRSSNSPSTTKHSTNPPPPIPDNQPPNPPPSQSSTSPPPNGAPPKRHLAIRTNSRPANSKPESLLRGQWLRSPPA